MYPSLKKAVQLATLPASIPDPAPILSRRWNHGSAYIHDGVNENPAEVLRGQVSQAQADLDELQQMISRAKQLCNRAESKPFVERGWNAQVTAEEAAEIRRSRASLDEFTAALPETFQAMIAAVEKLNLELGEHFAGDVLNERKKRKKGGE